MLHFGHTQTILCKGRKRRKLKNATHLQIPPQTHKNPTKNNCGSPRTLSPAVQLPTGVKDLDGGKPRERPLMPAH